VYRSARCGSSSRCPGERWGGEPRRSTTTFAPVDDRHGHTGCGRADHRLYPAGQYPVSRLLGHRLIAGLVRRHRGRDLLPEHATLGVDLLDGELHRLDLRRAQKRELTGFRQHVTHLQGAVTDE
jgi:hypothetical protein